MSFATVKVFPSLVNSLGLDVMFWINSGFCALMCVIGGLLIPETQGKTLTELAQMYEKKKKLKTDTNDLENPEFSNKEEEAQNS